MKTRLLLLISLLLFVFSAQAAPTADEALFNELLKSQGKSIITTPTVTDKNEKPPVQTEANKAPEAVKNAESAKSRIYGHDIFSAGSQFVADQNTEVPDDYTLGAGDSVVLQFWGRITKTENISVDRAGNIFSETLGKINLVNKTYADARKLVQQMVSSMEGVSASLTIDNTKTVKVLVSGNVSVPGYYMLNVFSNITQAIINAGGVRDNADIRSVGIIRDGRTIETIDYYDLIDRGSYRAKLKKLMPNDVIFVPRSTKRIEVKGAVKNEGFFDLKRETTIKDVVRLAGGLKANALTNNVTVSRLDSKDMRFVVKSINMNRPADAAFRMNDGDVITVTAANAESSNSVRLSGNVYFPGEYEYKRGMRISDVIRDSSQLLKDTEIESAYIIRRDIATSEIKLISFKLKSVFDNSASKENLLLQPYDEIVIVNRYEILGNIEISVMGSVTKSGSIVADKNATVYDMIVKAGGLTSDANVNDIEVVTFSGGNYSSDTMDINRAMAYKAPIQGFIVVHGVYETNVMNKVEIRGDVFSAGEFMFYEGMTLRDLLVKSVAKEDSDSRLDILLYRYNQQGNREIFSFVINGLRDEKNLSVLHNGDIIEVKTPDRKIKRYVSIEGAVLSRGQYIFGRNMTVDNLISLAGGFKDSAFRDYVEIIRKTIDGERVKQEYVKVEKQEYSSYTLMPNDRMVVKDISEYNKMEYVTLGGEFVFPGRYPISKGEKLSTIIERAGGFTPQAYLYGLQFTRDSVKREKQKMLDSMVARLERQLITAANVQAMTAASDATLNSAELFLKTKNDFIETLKNVKPDGRVVITMSHPRLLKGSVNDVELENGDYINVPKIPDFITVSGSVLNQGAFVYNSKMNWGDYIKIAGGFLSNADRSNIYIMKADGTAQKVDDGAITWSPQNDRWEIGFFSKGVELKPGDNIIVPDDYNKIAWLRNFKDITQILMQIAVTAGVAVNLY